MADAAKIINDAAAAREALAAPRGLRVDTHSRVRDPFRVIRVVEIEVPPCPAHPKGKCYLVHPRQVLKHLELFPGSYVVREYVRREGKRLHVSDVDPVGHGHAFGFLKGRKVH